MTLNHNADKQFQEKLLAVTEQNLGNEKFGVPELAEAMNMSRATLHRKVVKLTQQSASSYIRHARLKRAKELLHQNAGTVAEIAYEVGFSNATYFVTCYRELYGYACLNTKK